MRPLRTPLHPLHGNGAHPPPLSCCQRQRLVSMRSTPPSTPGGAPSPHTPLHTPLSCCPRQRLVSMRAP